MYETKNANACIFSLIAKTNRFTYSEFSCVLFLLHHHHHHVAFAFVCLCSFFLNLLAWLLRACCYCCCCCNHSSFDPSLFNWLTALNILSRPIFCCMRASSVLSLSLFILFIASFVYFFHSFFLTFIMCCPPKV